MLVETVREGRVMLVEGVEVIKGGTEDVLLPLWWSEVGQVAAEPLIIVLG